MNDELKTQWLTVERSLGECMIQTAFTIVRVWMNELGEEAGTYESAFDDIHSRYMKLFTRWLSMDDPTIEDALDSLTCEAYQLSDAVYADLRIKRGLSPMMHSFNSTSPTSVMQYFEHNVRLTAQDLEWVTNAMNDRNQLSIALMAVTALGKNIRTCFNQERLMVLINGSATENELVSSHCLTTLIGILLHYDVRIGFFPEIQNAFIEALHLDSETDSEKAFAILLAWIETSNKNLLLDYVQGLSALSWLPQNLKKLIESIGIDGNYEVLTKWAENQSVDMNIKALIDDLPNTWLAEVLVMGNKSRERRMAFSCLQAEHREYIWNYPDVGEQYYRAKLRTGKHDASDYINYAHCLMLKGDRMMAFENYKQARQLCGSIREFYDLFRPDRRQLVEHGVPLEYVYAMEDNLITG